MRNFRRKKSFYISLCPLTRRILSVFDWLRVITRESRIRGIRVSYPRRCSLSLKWKKRACEYPRDQREWWQAISTDNYQRRVQPRIIARLSIARLLSMTNSQAAFCHFLFAYRSQISMFVAGSADNITRSKVDVSIVSFRRFVHFFWLYSVRSVHTFTTLRLIQLSSYCRTINSFSSARS